MRTNADRGADTWILAIPLVALLVVSTMSSDGLSLLEDTLRNAVTSLVEFVSELV